MKLARDFLLEFVLPLPVVCALGAAGEWLAALPWVQAVLAGLT